MSLGDCRRFLGQFFRAPTTVGAVSPSSYALTRRMLEWIDWTEVEAVAEYGPGTGVFTQAVAEHIRTDATFFAIEINPEFIALLQSRLPDVRIYHDSVGNVRQLCQREGIDRLDAIICGLPWASFSNDRQSEFLDATVEVLRPGGQFATFAYLQGLLLPAGQRFRRKLGEYFQVVERSRTVWANIPPAFVYRCRR